MNGSANLPAKANWLTAWSTPLSLASSFILGCVATGLVVFALTGSRWAARPTVLERGAASAIDINHAGRAQLLQLPGVGPHLAQRIEADLQENGPYREVSDLARVSGVGPATVERLRPWIKVSDDSGEKSAKAAKPKAGKSKKTPPARPIDVNGANEAQLQTLPGIGPSIAKRIIETREKAPFTTVDDLRHVPGIGPKILERIRPYIEIDTSMLAANRDGRSL